MHAQRVERDPPGHDQLVVAAVVGNVVARTAAASEARQRRRRPGAASRREPRHQRRRRAPAEAHAPRAPRLPGRRGGGRYRGRAARPMRAPSHGDRSQSCPVCVVVSRVLTFGPSASRFQDRRFAGPGRARQFEFLSGTGARGWQSQAEHASKRRGRQGRPQWVSACIRPFRTAQRPGRRSHRAPARSANGGKAGPAAGDVSTTAQAALACRCMCMRIGGRCSPPRSRNLRTSTQRTIDQRFTYREPGGDRVAVSASRSWNSPDHETRSCRL
jgi:hypothetical protein